MAEGLNKCQFIGNLGADGEFRVTPGGHGVLKLRLACTERYQDKGSQWQERTEWVRVTVWGKRAEGLSKYTTKGKTLYVEGRLQTSSYEKNGEKRYSTEVVADKVLLLGGERGQPRESSHGSDEDAPDYGGTLPAPGTRSSGSVERPASSPDDDIPFAVSWDLEPCRHDRRALRWQRW